MKSRKRYSSLCRPPRRGSNGTSIRCPATEDTHRPAAEARGQRDTRSAFDRFVEAAYLKVSRPTFFFVCSAIVIVWLFSLPLWADLKAWQVAVAEALAALMASRAVEDPKLDDAVQKLRDAVGLEERH